MIAAVVPCAPFHASILPDSVENMKVAGVAPIRNCVVGLKTCPVGPPDVLTTSGPPCGAPEALYNVATFVTWSETQKGLVGENDTPQGFFKFESVTAARPDM